MAGSSRHKCREMVFRVLISAAALAAFAAQPAFGQIFVSGGGDAFSCFEAAERGKPDPRVAIQICDRALSKQPLTGRNRANTFVNRGILKMRSGDYDGSEADFQRALRLTPKSGEAHLNLGAAQIYQRRFADALPHLERAIDLDSGNLFAAFYNRAVVHENLGDLDAAYADYQQALNLRPGWELAEKQLDRFVVVEQ